MGAFLDGQGPHELPQELKADQAARQWEANFSRTVWGKNYQQASEWRAKEPFDKRCIPQPLTCYLLRRIRWMNTAPANSRAMARATTSVVRCLGSDSPMNGSDGRSGLVGSSCGCWTGVGWGSTLGGGGVGVGVGVGRGVGVSSLGSMTVTGSGMLDSTMVGRGTCVGSSFGRGVGVGPGFGVGCAVVLTFRSSSLDPPFFSLSPLLSLLASPLGVGAGLAVAVGAGNGVVVGRGTGVVVGGGTAVAVGWGAGVGWLGWLGWSPLSSPSSWVGVGSGILVLVGTGVAVGVGVGVAGASSSSGALAMLEHARIVSSPPSQPAAIQAIWYQ